MGAEGPNPTASRTSSGRIFFSGGGQHRSGKSRHVQSCLGTLTISQRQGKRLKLPAHSQISPALQKCCLRLCAQSSYQQAEANLKTVMGLSIGHSSLHRLVGRVELTPDDAHHPAEAASIDGGKIRLRNPTGGPGQWREYKAVRLHQGVCVAFFQQAQALERWSNRQPLSPIFTCLGDGHDGVWNIAQSFGTAKIVIRRQVLDWYHLMENLHKVGGSIKRLVAVEALLWHGQLEAAIDAFEGLRQQQAKRFQSYLRKHRQRLPDYASYQRLGLPIGSGTVESSIKQIGARVKIAGASWKADNVAKILRLRCAYLNNSPSLSICT